MIDGIVHCMDPHFSLISPTMVMRTISMAYQQKRLYLCVKHVRVLFAMFINSKSMKQLWSPRLFVLYSIKMLLNYESSRIRVLLSKCICQTNTIFITITIRREDPVGFVRTIKITRISRVLFSHCCCSFIFQWYMFRKDHVFYAILQCFHQDNENNYEYFSHLVFPHDSI